MRSIILKTRKFFGKRDWLQVLDVFLVGSNDDEEEEGGTWDFSFLFLTTTRLARIKQLKLHEPT